jgi:hypothetical protein
MPNEYEKPVTPVSVHCGCDGCGRGEMQVEEGGMMLTSMPPKWWHKCDRCGHRELYTVKYPYIKYKEQP